MDRRTFLQGSVALAAAGFHARLFAAERAPARDGRLLVVFLRGAYDAANALVPIASEDYYALRPTLAIPRPDAGNPLAALRLDDDWGLHPAMARGLAPLLARGEVTFVPFVGVPDASRSHFQVQDLIEAGEDGRREVRHADGLLYRLAARTGLSGAISYTETIPTILRGDEPVANIGLRRGKRRFLRAEDKQEIDALYQGHPLADLLTQAEHLRAQGGDAGEMVASARGAGGAGAFTRQAPKMARYLRKSHRLAFVDVGGWDTHVAQGGSEGALATQLGRLCEGLTVFAAEMGEAWRHTTVVVLSEFGRTFRENGNRGTDHGHGTVYWLLGGSIAGAPVRGPRLALRVDTLHEGRDYPVLLDYRALLGEAAGQAFRLDDDAVQGIFGVAPSRLLRT